MVDQFLAEVDSLQSVQNLNLGVRVCRVFVYIFELLESPLILVFIVQVEVTSKFQEVLLVEVSLVDHLHQLLALLLLATVVRGDRLL